MKPNFSALVFAIAIVIASFILGKAYKDRNKTEGKIQVTGLGKQDFTSDLIVWEASFSAANQNLKLAYAALEKDKQTIKTYLTKKGVSADNLVFSAVKTSNKTKSNYAPNGNYIGDEFVGYELSQTVLIESKRVDKIEKISREITELLNDGVGLYSEAPRYYYTSLADLKIEMISKATKDARIRAEKIAEFSGGALGKIKSAKMGVFQITGLNSKEEYSWGGTFNTSSKEKTASITMKLVYDAN